MKPSVCIGRSIRSEEANCDYRTAAYTIAIGRVAEACRMKGLFP
ncbi:MAG: hypothetical protein ACK4PI_05775 [Tepidisphaerales bacterium]